MNNMANMPNMNNMGGGPVGPPMNMMNNGGLAPPSQPPNQTQLNDSGRTTLLNTYIYDYFIRNHMFECARAVFSADPHINVIKDSPGKVRDENGNLLGNGDLMDTDTKDGLDQKRPDDLPAPKLPVPTPDSCFLYDWFCLFWDMFHSQKGKGSSSQINQYVQHTQAQSRMRQEQQRELLRGLRPEFAPQQFHPNMMGRMPNGPMNMQGMKQNLNLQRTAVANSQNPQTMQLLHKQAAGQMPRDPSDGNRGGPGSPGSAENAPSPSKRPRLDGGAPFNPNQGVMMPNGRPGQGMPGQPQNFASAAPNAKTLAMYSTNMSQHHGSQMPNKPMPHTAGPQGQGSSMVPPGPDGNSLSQYYNPGDLGPGNMRPGAPNGQATANSNHALQDYQMQLMLLEQQNKKRLMMARQEQDMTTNIPRVDGPGGPGGPNATPGPNGQGFQGTSPPGGRSGASPNPSESMKRNQQMGNPPNMGSPLPDGAQSRNSPNAMNFLAGNMDPNGIPMQHMNMNMNMAAAQMNGGMRPPSSHPQFSPMNQQQMIAARQAQAQAQAQANAQGAQMQWQQGPNGQMIGQPPQPQMQGGPAQNQRSMPPPSAPATAAVAANVANARNTTASPQVTNAAPPTPQQGNKAAPKKKETKATKAKPKKSNTNLNNAGATPAADVADTNQEAPTPATPITPANPAGFSKTQNSNAGQGVPNGQPAAPAPPPQPAPVAAPPQHSDPNQAASFLETGTMDFPLGFADPMQSDNVLDGFDFDTFLHEGNSTEDNTFDFSGGFSMEGDATIGAAD